jgi:hypothetical protein
VLPRKLCGQGKKGDFAVKKEIVLAALGQPENEAINWAIGLLLRQRLEQEGSEGIIILQHLASASPRLQAWNALFDRARKALGSPDELPMKAELLLANVKIAKFDDALDDLNAELLGVLYLAAQGHGSIRFLPEGDDITVDFESKFAGITYFTEIKNLREPKSLSFVAFKRWQRNRSADPQKFSFRADFVDIDDPFEDLTSEQESAVNALVDGLPDCQVPSTVTRMFPGGRRIRIRLAEGTPVMIRQGPGPFLVGPVVEEAQRGLVLKLLEPARKALSQLYRSGIPPESRRLLLVRWKLPEEIAAIGESESVRTAVHEQTQGFLRSFFPNFALTIMHNTEDPNEAPKATWD